METKGVFLLREGGATIHATLFSRHIARPFFSNLTFSKIEDESRTNLSKSFTKHI
jgi:hypothetical protein